MRGLFYHYERWRLRKFNNERSGMVLNLAPLLKALERESFVAHATNKFLHVNTKCMMQLQVTS